MFPENLGQQFLLHPDKYTPNTPTLRPLPLEEPVNYRVRERFLLRSGQLLIALGSSLKKRANGMETAVSIPTVSPLHVEKGIYQNGANLPCRHNGVSLLKRTPGDNP
jgi:hypothetical protein